MSDSVQTVNAAAAAIVVAESRVQPSSSSVQKRRWGSCWSMYSCFGYQKTSKQVDHAVLPLEPIVHGNTISSAENPNHPTPMAIPFVAPPSSPASFLPSDPSTAIHSPGGPVNLASFSVSTYSPPGPANIFATGPYAYETQLVSPPVFSAFTTEPSTAAVTPPPEPVQSTTPSSPEVPFAQLLTSSLNRARRSNGPNQKNGLSYYEFHQLYSGSPASHLISPGSVNSTSGTSSPYPVRPRLLEFRIADASKLFDSKMFTAHKWGSRIGSGSLTPDGLGPASHQISEVVSLANSEHGSETGEGLVDHRVSFELTGEDAPTCLEKMKSLPGSPHEKCSHSISRVSRVSEKSDGGSYCELCMEETKADTPEGLPREAMNCKHKQSSVSLGSMKEFNFDSINKGSPNRSTMSTKWWTDEDVEMDAGPSNSWTFFPLLQPGVS